MATTMIATTYPAGPLLLTTVFVSPVISNTGAVVLTNDGDAFYDTWTIYGARSERFEVKLTGSCWKPNL